MGIVRVLINFPEILFADEPTGVLNSQTGLDMLDTLTRFNEQSQSVIMVTHDMRSAWRGNRILYLKDGVILGEFDLGRYVFGDGGAAQKAGRVPPGYGVVIMGEGFLIAHSNLRRARGQAAAIVVLMAAFLGRISIVKCTFVVPVGLIAAAGVGLVLFTFGMLCLLSLRIKKIMPKTLLLGE